MKVIKVRKIVSFLMILILLGTMTPKAALADEYDPILIFYNYVASRAFREYISDTEYAEENLEYMITDLNGDETEELLIQSTVDAPFYTTWTFVLDKGSVCLVSENYGYGQIRYSQKWNMVLLPAETSPEINLSSVVFCTLSSEGYTYEFKILTNESGSYYIDDQEEYLLSSNENNEYFNNMVNYTFSPINEVAQMQPLQTEETNKEGTIEQLVEGLGIASQEPFVSCIGSEIMPYPEEITGVVSATPMDLNMDGKTEWIVLRIGDGGPELQNASLYCDVYDEDMNLTSSMNMHYMEYCMSSSVYLFYSAVLEEYCLVIESYSSGAYTGVSYSSAGVYTLKVGQIELYGRWDFVPGIAVDDDPAEELIHIGAPYAKYCTEINDTENAKDFVFLCEIQHEIFGDSAFYEDWTHYLTVMNTVEAMEFPEMIPEEDSGENDELPSDNQYSVYSDNRTGNVGVQDAMTLCLEIGSANSNVEVTDITADVADPSMLNITSMNAEDSCYYIEVVGLQPGETSIIFSNSNTGELIEVPITVYDPRCQSFTVSSMASGSMNGLYIENYEYIMEDGEAHISFEALNTNSTFCTVEVREADGSLHSAELIGPMEYNPKSYMNENGVYMTELTDLSSKLETYYDIDVIVPENGYVKICTSAEDSLLCGFINAADLVIMSALTEEGWEQYNENRYHILYYVMYRCYMSFDSQWFNDVSSRIDMFCQDVMNEDKNAYLLELINDMNDMPFGNQIHMAIEEYELPVDDSIIDCLITPDDDILENIKKMDLKEELINQIHEYDNNDNIMNLVIQNQTEDLRSVYQIQVYNEYGFDDDVALDINKNALSSELLKVIESSDQQLYEDIIIGNAYTYEMTLLQNGNIVENQDPLTVTIPLHNEMIDKAEKGKLDVYLLAEDGTTTKIAAKVVAGSFEFTAEKLGIYVIAERDTSDAIEFGEMLNKIAMIGIIGLSASVIAGIVVVIFIHRKKR